MGKRGAYSSLGIIHRKITVSLLFLIKPFKLVVLQWILLGQRLLGVQFPPADVGLESKLVRNILNGPLHCILADCKVATLLVTIATAGLLVSIVVQYVLEFVQITRCTWGTSTARTDFSAKSWSFGASNTSSNFTSGSKS